LKKKSLATQFYQTLFAKKKDAGAQGLAKHLLFNLPAKCKPNLLMKFAKCSLPFAQFGRQKKLFILCLQKIRSRMFHPWNPDTMGKFYQCSLRMQIPKAQKRLTA